MTEEAARPDEPTRPDDAERPDEPRRPEEPASPGEAAPPAPGEEPLAEPTPADPLAGVPAEVMGRVNEVVLGQQALVRDVLVTILAGGHALIEGVPGTAKTLAVRALALALDIQFGRVQFTPDLMPNDLVGVNVLDSRDGSFSFRPGPVFAGLLLADEINRAPAKTQSALLEAMEERQVTVDGQSRRLPAAFTVLATQNPVEFEGTYPLPEAQLDRFLLKIDVDYPPEDAERSILDRYAGGFESSKPESFGIAPVASGQDLQSLRARVSQVFVDPKIRDYVTRIVRATRTEPSFSMGASPRAGVALFLAARAHAFLQGRDFVTPDDVKELAWPALRHRVVLTPEIEVQGEGVDIHLTRVLDSVDAPDD